MNIAHVVSSLDPFGGGPPIVAARLAAEQARQGHQVQIVSFAAPDAQKRIDAMIGPLPGADLVKYQTMNLPGPFERFLPFDTRREMDQFFKGVQVVHLHGVWDSILKSAATVARRKQIPYVIQSHGMLDPWSMNQKAWKKRLALRMGYRQMLDEASFLHTLNRDEATLLQPLGLKAAVEVIPNGIAPQEFADLPTIGSFRKTIPELVESPYVLFLSRLHQKKGLDILAAAFALLAGQMPGVHLVVAGPDEGARAGFAEAIQAAGLQPRVHLVGPLFGRDKLAAFVDSACFCLPSRQEGFSVAILEAMACAKPVVISAPCHFPEVAEAGAGKIVELDPAEIASALQSILSNPELAHQMGKAGHDLVISRFTWPMVVTQLIAAYQTHRATETQRRD